jgi:hypothetical protein
MWPSLAAAERIADLANIFFIGSLIVGVVSTVTIVWMTGVKEAHWEKDRQESAERIATLTTQGDQLRKDTAVANEHAAEANSRAIEAQLELEKFKKPRSISVEQRNRIAGEMKKFEGQQYFGMVASDVADAWDIWREISLSLELAGWQRLPPPGLQVTQYGPPAGIPLAPQAGVMVLSSVRNSTPRENMALHERAKALAAQLTDESIIAGAGFSMELNPNTIAIVIGPKP